MKNIFPHLLILILSLSCLNGSVIAQNERLPEPAAVQQAVLSLAQIQAALSAGETFRYETSVKFTMDEAYRNLISPEKRPAKEQVRRIAGSYSGTDGKIVYEHLSDKGAVTERELYFINKENVVIENSTNGATAMIKAIKGRGETSLPPTVDGPLLIFGFLQSQVDSMGIRAITPTVFKSAEAWKEIATALATAVPNDNGDLSVTMKRKTDIVTVTLSRAPSGNSYWPSGLRITNLNNSLITEVKVKEFFTDPALPGIPKRLESKFYIPQSEPGSSILVSTGDYVVKEFAKGVAIDKEELAFDPTSVNSIFDTDARVTIQVPH